MTQENREERRKDKENEENIQRSPLAQIGFGVWFQTRHPWAQMHRT